MTREGMLQYAKDNYSIGDRISRKGFYTNSNTVTIESGNQGHHHYNNNQVFY